MNKITWTTQYGKRVQIKDLDNTHLVNLIDFLNNHTRYTNNPLMSALACEFQERKLDPIVLQTGQIPYRDGEGHFRIWDHEKFESVIVGTYE